jgi:hypothetical protein
MVNLKESVNIYGQMENFIKDNGQMVSNMVLECGKVLKVILILENGDMEKLMDMEYILG